MENEIRKDKKVHTSVLYSELIGAVTQVLKQSPNPKVVVDGTLGYGGHALGVISKMNSKDTFIGFDADERNLSLAKERIQKQIQKSDAPKTIFIHSNFGQLEHKLQEVGINGVDAIYLDLGVSSIHFDEVDRGFTFRKNSPLDMRFDASKGETAADLLQKRTQDELADIFYYYGEERASKKIARVIVEVRRKQKIRTSDDLNAILDSVHPNKKLKTKIYQALRIAVNKELDNLEKCLIQSQRILNTDGILFVISFHSLEDRIVKQFLRKYSRDCVCREIVCNCSHSKSMKVITKKPIIPTEEEQKENPRSKSAKARIGIKL